MRVGVASTNFAVGEGDPLPPDNDAPVNPEICLDSLYRSQRPRLLRFFSGRGSSEGAADMVQQLFLRVAAFDPQRLAKIESPGAYLRQSARNLLRDEAKLAVRHRMTSHISADDVSLAAPDQLEALEARDMLARVEAAVLQLKPLTRQIFLAHRIDGYSYAEIALRTGLSVKGVEKQMSRAIKHLSRLAGAR